jgi:chemotaxis protein histidine kinase CheA
VTSESISILIQQLESLSELANSYQKENSKDLLDAVAQKLEEIGTCAGDQKMPGFQDVCFLLEDFLLETPDGSVYKATQQQQLVDWIGLAKNYINHADDANSENVLNIFKVDCWSAPLLETDTNFMKEMLLKSEDDSAIDDKKLEIKPEPESETEPGIESESEPEPASEDKESNEGMSLSLGDCFGRLEEIVTHENISDLDSLGSLSEAINEFAQAVAKELSLGFQDICLLLDENILELVEQRKDLSSTQKTLVTAWVGLAGKYINDPENNDLGKALLLNLENQQWPLPLGREDTSMIAGMMGIKLKDKKAPVGVETDESENLVPDIISDSPSASDSLDQLKQALNDYKSENNTDIETIIRLIENLSSHATESDLHGFNDVCLLLQQNIEDIADENNLLSEPQLQALQNWTTSANTYLNNPKDISVTSHLIEILKDSHWPTSLTDEDITVIKEMFWVSDENMAGTELPAEATAGSAADPIGALKTAIENYKTELSLEKIITHLEEISSNAAESNFLGFEDVCMLLQQNLEDLVDDKKDLSDTQLHVLQQWADDASNYISDQNNNTAVLSLINALTSNHWSSSLIDADIPMIKEMFGLVDEPDQIAEPSPAKATVLDIKQGITKIENEIIESSVDVTAEACPVSPMLIDMLLDEIKKIEKGVEETRIKITSESTDKKIRSDALMQLAVRFERFGNACQAAELAGLYQASEIIHKNIALLDEADAFASQELGDLIGKWPRSVKEYLQSLGDNLSSDYLVSTLGSDAWHNPLMSEVAPALIDLLNAPYSSEEETKEIRQTKASAEDVSLELPTDISQELLDGLLQELPSQTEGFSNAIQALIDGSGDSKESEKAQRIAHTVKGAANTVGIRGIASLTHHIEDIFLLLNEHNKLPSSALASSLIVAADCLEEMSESLISQGNAPANALEVFQDILNWINRLESEGIEILDDDDDTAPVPESTTNKNDIAEKPEDETEDEQLAIVTLRVQAPIIDDLIRLLGETIILTTQLQEKIKNSTDEAEELIAQNEASHELVNQLEQQVELRGTANVQQAVNQNEVFDSLELEHYNELNTVTNQLAETTLDSVELNRDIKRDLRELGELLIDQSRLHREVQGLVMRTRMVPIKTITPRLQRSVRQTCRAVDKQASLHLTGTDTLIDSDILNNLVDPLIHMLRNSLDHGIEDREMRIKKNKNPEGRIDLSFSSEGTQIVVRCKDDGAGLDHEAIRVTAIKRRLIEPDDKLAPIELDRMILRPGFSTSKKTTQVSGRGIGMDLVYSQILASKGTLHIESEKNKGLQIELRMPVTLISSHVLMIRHRNKMLAVSSRGVEQILHPSDSEIIESDNGYMCKVENDILELSNLEDLIDYPGDRRLADRETRPALLIREEEINKVVYIQEIVDSRELVIKSMGKHMNNIRGIPGATILGDGSVVPVLDIPDLLRSSTHSEDSTEHDDLEHTRIFAALPSALVVDDSLSARRALAQVVRDAGYDVRTAKDGVEAVEIIDKKTPDILLVDMEMPRMNGMELTAYVRANQETADIPVIMVTSRSTEKHREQASSAGVNVHLTKPFSDDDLLDHISKLLT